MIKRYYSGKIVDDIDIYIDIYGKKTKDIPGFNTLKILEKRKNYILKKLQTKIEKKSYLTYLIKEIRALEKTINFIKWIQNNLSNETVKETLKQYKTENLPDDKFHKLLKNT